MSEFRYHPPVRDARHALQLLDDVNALLGFCAAYMPDVERYYRGAEAMWQVAYWLAAQDRLARQHHIRKAHWRRQRRRVAR